MVKVPELHAVETGAELDVEAIHNAIGTKA